MQQAGHMTPNQFGEWVYKTIAPHVPQKCQGYEGKITGMLLEAYSEDRGGLVRKLNNAAQRTILLQEATDELCTSPAQKSNVVDITCYAWESFDPIPDASMPKLHFTLQWLWGVKNELTNGNHTKATQLFLDIWFHWTGSMAYWDTSDFAEDARNHYLERYRSHVNTLLQKIEMCTDWGQILNLLTRETAKWIA